MIKAYDPNVDLSNLSFYDPQQDIDLTMTPELYDLLGLAPVHLCEDSKALIESKLGYKIDAIFQYPNGGYDVLLLDGQTRSFGNLNAFLAEAFDNDHDRVMWKLAHA